ncbi:uncharacterized protein EV420DRAFT_1481721 [Desarmillaria tabescens]|uniref:Uncharacterized protein n=1 Tax=Armillaria tabescens TaxID=1929756 RepID=A0AA39K3N9_ARMTA|nr:uncharacterized protein EV420DRAFT_1481721 [Desarmillaria tabescens]KAK0453997.1 hypothetical protein EV420DRAFT_1481721 [Desarmillaria tabescens]
MWSCSSRAAFLSLVLCLLTCRNYGLALLVDSIRCGERIGVPDRGGPWFRAAMDCCKDVGLEGLLNVLSDLDCSDGSHPRIAALLQIINSSFVNSRQPIHSLTGPVIKCSKLLKLMDEMFHVFMLDDIPLDSDAWRVYEQMVTLLRTFSCDSQLKLLIQMDTCWIRDGLQEDWDHGLPTLILQKYQGRSMREAKDSPHKHVTVVFLKAIQAE